MDGFNYPNIDWNNLHTTRDGLEFMNLIMDNFLKVSKSAKIRNRYNQVPHLTQDTNGKVTNLQ